MLRITYDSMSPVAMPDGRCETMALELYLRSVAPNCFGHPLTEYITSSENLINAFRVLIKEKKINHAKIKFFFKGEEIHFNEHGRSDNWPKGFCDTSLDLSLRMLKPNKK